MTPSLNGGLTDNKDESACNQTGMQQVTQKRSTTKRKPRKVYKKLTKEQRERKNFRRRQVYKNNPEARRLAKERAKKRVLTREQMDLKKLKQKQWRQEKKQQRLLESLEGTDDDNEYKTSTEDAGQNSLKRLIVESTVQAVVEHTKTPSLNGGLKKKPRKLTTEQRETKNFRRRQVYKNNPEARRKEKERAKKHYKNNSEARRKAKEQAKKRVLTREQKDLKNLKQRQRCQEQNNLEQKQQRLNSGSEFITIKIKWANFVPVEGSNNDATIQSELVESSEDTDDDIKCKAPNLLDLDDCTEDADDDNKYKALKFLDHDDTEDEVLNLLEDNDTEDDIDEIII